MEVSSPPRHLYTTRSGEPLEHGQNKGDTSEMTIRGGGPIIEKERFSTVLKPLKSSKLSRQRFPAGTNHRYLMCRSQIIEYLRRGAVGLAFSISLLSDAEEISSESSNTLNAPTKTRTLKPPFQEPSTCI
ncbi:hypothetical protein RRG08_062085 [Elysia crispata]|uniref:Uncharacterized protein n=1 Tax=Elysia crispata TaxID=231223 RepID=A0AAE0ZI81_9GAST|nr:hypothetical protein RRG08_062085 [Elysia crispata]